MNMKTESNYPRFRRNCKRDITLGQVSISIQDTSLAVEKHLPFMEIDQRLGKGKSLDKGHMKGLRFARKISFSVGGNIRPSISLMQ